MTDVAHSQDPAESMDAGAATTSRRQLLRLGGTGVAAAAAAAAAGVIASASPAGAVGSTVTVDGSFSGGGTTQLTDSQLRVVIDNGNRVAIVGQNMNTSGISLGNGVQGDGVIGVVGNNIGTSGGVGVAGNATSSSTVTAIGVHGVGAGGTGSIGAFAENTGAGTALRAKSVSGPVAFLEQTTPPSSIPPTTGAWTEGTILVKGGHVFYCYHSGTGTASKWVKLSGGFVPLNPPKRAYTSTAGGGKLALGATRAVSLTPSGFPVGASSVLLNLSVGNTVGKGALSIYADGTAFPGTNNIHWWGSNQNLANSVTSLVSAAAKISVRCIGDPGAKTDFSIDVFGYYP